MTIKETMDNALKLAGQTKCVEISQGALKRVPNIFREYFPGEKAIVVTDLNTWTAAGEALYNIMNAAGIECLKYVIEERSFHAEMKYVDLIQGILKQENAIALAVGSGVINDLCKLAAYRLGKKYICVASAASADGYSASGSAIIFEGAKQTFKCDAPLVIIGDVDVLRGAPAHLTVAGYGDLAAKVTCGAEWMIADLFGTEPINDVVWHVIHDKLPELLADAQGIADRTPEALEKLFAGLTISGVAMQIANGDTRPLSCAEHLYGHILDMTNHEFNGRHPLHGYQVAIGSLTMCAFFDELYKYDLTKIDVEKCVAAWPTLEQEQNRAKEMFKNFPVPNLGYEMITKKWQPKEEIRRQLTLVKENWPEFKKKLQNQTYTFEKMYNLFSTAGAPTDPSQIGVSREKLRKDTDMVQLFRWRINLFDLAKRAGIYDQLLDGVFGKGGRWEIK
ncbi:MAG: sn-glycerol-1-phosphate dehydrogenase [Alistipes sp.]|nr:sn-glycerol-1-phosphate dehydrogenase [Candidatus Alistipes equi]